MNPHAARILRDRALSATWQRCRPHLAALCAFLLAFLFCRFGLASENPSMDKVVAAVAMVESGATWKDTGTVTGSWSLGGAGEISHWQITAAVLSDLQLTGKTRKIASDPVYAESVFRLWYSRLLHATGSHREALAAYHRGLGGRHRRDARDYAQRVLNLASVL